MRVPHDIVEHLRQGKADLRTTRRALTLPEKVQQVVELQKIAIQIAKSRNKLTGRERVWKLHR